MNPTKEFIIIIQAKVRFNYQLQLKTSNSKNKNRSSAKKISKNSYWSPNSLSKYSDIKQRRELLRKYDSWEVQNAPVWATPSHPKAEFNTLNPKEDIQDSTIQSLNFNDSLKSKPCKFSNILKIWIYTVLACIRQSSFADYHKQLLKSKVRYRFI